jgi:hypothetical protein
MSTGTWGGGEHILYSILIEFGMTRIKWEKANICLMHFIFIMAWSKVMRYALLPFLFKFSLEYDTRKVQEDKEYLKWIGHIRLWPIVMLNLLSEIINIVKKITEVLLDASMEVCLDVKGEKTKHMSVSSHQTTEENC